MAPCAILWTDPERLWEGVVEGLKTQLPELFVYGAYAPEARTGPAVYLRCIEARAMAPILPEGQLPVFYLPQEGIRGNIRKQAILGIFGAMDGEQ